MELNENEIMVLSTAFVDVSQGMVVLGMLSVGDFSHPVTQAVYSSIYTLITKRLPVDELSVCQTVSATTENISDEFIQAVKGIINAGQHTDDIGYYAKKIRDDALSRRLARCGRDITTLAGSPGDAIAAVTRAQDMVLGLSRLYADDDDLQGTEKSVEKILKEMRDRRGNPQLVTGVPSGFHELDETYTGGWQRGDLIILAARPSMGKTAFMVNMCEHVAVTCGKPVYIFSLEMSREQLLLRMMASLAKVPSNLIRNGQVPDDKVRAVKAAAETLQMAPIFINDNTSMNIGLMQMLIQKATLEYGHIEMICVDYLQLMEGKNTKESRNEQISGISRGLKQVARQSQAPVIALSQLSRAVEARENKRPQLSDLRDSGSIAQDADAVIFLYRDEYYKKDKSEHPGIGEVIIGKQRNGPVGDVKLYWNSTLTQYLNPGRKWT